MILKHSKASDTEASYIFFPTTCEGFFLVLLVLFGITHEVRTEVGKLFSPSDH